MSDATFQSASTNSHSHRRALIFPLALCLAVLAACGGGGGGAGDDTTTTPPTNPAKTQGVESYQGNYTISGDKLTLNFSVNPKGEVACTGSSFVVCSGRVDAAGGFTINGNDGQSPVDTTAILVGGIDGGGNIVGSFTANSVSSGSVNGALTGRPTVASITPTAQYQGIYSVSGDGISANVTVSPTGVATCTGGGLSACSGQVTASGTFAIKGNDGLSPIDTTATLNGSIDNRGSISGSFTTSSVTKGPQSGALSGQPATMPSRPPDVSSAAAYQGNYSVVGGDVKVNFVVDRTGSVTCVGSGLVVCKGQVTANGAFTINGNDGLSPIDTSASLTGTIEGGGNIAGNFVANSVSEGRATGLLTGQRTSAALPSSGVPTLTRISIDPDLYNIKGTSVSARMATSKTGCVSAIGTYSDGSTSDITSTVVWTSSQPMHATTPSEATRPSCALITGYLVDRGVDQTPKYPLGFAAGQSNIIARDPKTGIQGNLLLTVEPGLNEGSEDLPLQLGGTVSWLRPAIAGRNSYVSSLVGSHYEVLVKPLALYNVRISGQTARLALHVGPRRLQDCVDSDSIFRGLRCTGRADGNGMLRIWVSSVDTLDPPDTFVMDVSEVNQDLLVNVGSAAAPISLAPNSDPNLNDLVKFVGAGKNGCSYYNVPLLKSPQTFSFRDLTGPASVTFLTTPDKIINGYENSAITSFYDLTLVIDASSRKTMDFIYCHYPSSGVDENFGSSARFTTP